MRDTTRRHLQQQKVYSRDYFSDTAGTGLGSHTPSRGPAWTVVTGTPEIRALALSGAGGASNIGVVDTGYSDVVIEVDATHRGGGFEPAVILRYQNSTNYLVVYCNGSGTWRISEIRAGVETVKATGAQTIISGTTYRLRIEALGTAITLWVDGVQRATFATATFLVDKTSHGLDAYAAGGLAMYDGWRVRPAQGVSALALDRFTDTDSLPMARHGMTHGLRWTRQLGTPIILTNGFAGSTASDNLATIDPGRAGVVIECDYTYRTATYSGFVFLRYGTIADCWCVYYFNNATWRISQLAPGETVRASAAQALVNGTTYRMRVHSSGTTITLYVDDVEIVTYASATQPGNLVGLDAYNSPSNPMFDNFRVAAL